MRRTVGWICGCALLAASLSGSLYLRGIHRAKFAEETEQRARAEHSEDGKEFADAMHRFELERGRPPRSVSELVESGYLKGRWSDRTFYWNRYYDAPIQRQPGSKQAPPAS